MRCHPLKHDGGSRVKPDAVGNWYQSRCRNARVLRVCPWRHRPGDSGSGREITPGAGLFYCTGGFHSRGVRQGDLVKSAPLIEIDEIDSGCHDPDQSLVLARFGLGNFVEVQDFWTAKVLDTNGSHLNEQAKAWGWNWS